MNDDFEEVMARIEERLHDPARLDAVRIVLGRPVPTELHLLVYNLAVEFAVPLIAVTVLEGDEQHTLSASNGTAGARCRTGVSGCQFVVGSGKMVMLHKTQGPTWLQKMISEFLPNSAAVAYIGVPVTTVDGQVVGAVCAVDDKPRVWKAEEHFALYRMSEVVAQMMCYKEPDHV